MKYVTKCVNDMVMIEMIIKCVLYADDKIVICNSKDLIN